MSRLLQRPCRPDSPDAPRAGRPGFTLAEILVAVGVLLVAFLGVITVYLAGHGDIKEGGNDTIAAMAAQSLVERLRNLPAGPAPLPPILLGMNNVDTQNPATCPPDPPPPAPPQGLNAWCTAWAAQVSQQLPQGRATVTVVLNPAGPEDLVFSTISVSVFWTEPSRGARQLTVVGGRSS